MKSVLASLGVLICACILGANPSYAVEYKTVKVFPAGSFSKGWTHAITIPNGILWYNTDTGAAVFGKLDAKGNHTSIKLHNFTSGWTHVAAIPSGVLWYNDKTGGATVGVFDSEGNYSTLKVFQAGYFSTGWTNIVNTPDGILWYNSKNGAAAATRIE